MLCGKVQKRACGNLCETPATAGRTRVKRIRSNRFRPMKILLVHGIGRSDVDPNQTATPRAQGRAGMFGHLGRRYRNHKAVQEVLNRAAGVMI